jgi:dipeptidyl aminopeptidase/acylaminoacyl peptidase
MRGESLVVQEFDDGKLVLKGEAIQLPDHVYLNPGTSNALLSVSRAGMLVYSPATQSGGWELAWFDRIGKRGETIERGYLYGPILSPDGTHALLSEVRGDGLSSDLWNLDLVRGTKTRVTSGPGFKTAAAWEPDGRTAFTESFGQGPSRIYRVNTDGGKAVETILESDAVRESPWSVCRDGGYLAYSRSSIAEYPRLSIWILPLKGERKPFPLVQSQFTNNAPVFSPECNWVAYSSDESGEEEIYVTPFPDSTRRYQVSTETGVQPRWRGDGKELFYFSPKQSSIMAVDVQARGEDVSLARPHVLFALPSLTLPSQGGTGTLFDVTPDGHRFLVSGLHPPSGNIPLTLVENWDVELKKK